jgi:hypothetical protein
VEDVKERLFDKLRSGNGDRQQLLDECAAPLQDAVPEQRLIELGAAFEEVRIRELAVAGIRV